MEYMIDLTLKKSDNILKKNKNKYLNRQKKPLTTSTFIPKKNTK
jgi:hypothetical protein